MTKATILEDMRDHLRNTSGKLPYYETQLGMAYFGDSREILRHLPDDSIDVIMTSPPFALTKKKSYGNVSQDEYTLWFASFAHEFWRVLKSKGSLVIHIGGSWNKGSPTKSLYHLELLCLLCKQFYLAQDFYWWNPAKLPTPAEWVAVRRIRVKDAVDNVWWLSKTEYPFADNSKVLKEYSNSMKQLLVSGYLPKLRPSGHNISDKFKRDLGGAIPSNMLMTNLLTAGNTDSNNDYLKACKAAGIKPHPARFPILIPRFFLKLLTRRNSVVLDPFAGSNVTGEVAEKLGRMWISAEIDEEYVKGSMLRFSKAKKPRSR